MLKHGLSAMAIASSLLLVAPSAAQEAAPAPTSPSAGAPQSTVSPGFLYQTPSVQRFPSQPFLPTAQPGVFAQSKFYQNAYQQAQLYGRCVSRVVEGRADALLKADPNSSDERAALSNLVGLGRPCLAYGYTPQLIFLRGGIAEAMYLHAARAGVDVDRAATPAATIAFYAAETARSGARLADDKIYTAAADCLVVSAPSRVRAMLDSVHGSATERTALTDVFAGAPTCGNNLRIAAATSTTFVRAYLAEAAYRWAALTS